MPSVQADDPDTFSSPKCRDSCEYTGSQLTPLKGTACVCAKSLPSCPTLRDPIDCSLSSSSVRAILQQEYWKELPCPPPGESSGPRIEPVSLMSPALASGFFTTSGTWEAPRYILAFSEYPALFTGCPGLCSVTPPFCS